MSAPQTNVEKQAERHRPSLVGIGVAVVFALALLTALIVWVAADGGQPEGADAQVVPGVGTEEVSD